MSVYLAQYNEISACCHLPHRACAFEFDRSLQALTPLNPTAGRQPAREPASPFTGTGLDSLGLFTGSPRITSQTTTPSRLSLNSTSASQSRHPLNFGGNPTSPAITNPHPSTLGGSSNHPGLDPNAQMRASAGGVSDMAADYQLGENSIATLFRFVSNVRPYPSSTHHKLNALCYRTCRRAC